MCARVEAETSCFTVLLAGESDHPCHSSERAEPSDDADDDVSSHSDPDPDTEKERGKRRRERRFGEEW